MGALLLKRLTRCAKCVEPSVEIGPVPHQPFGIALVECKGFREQFRWRVRGCVPGDWLDLLRLDEIVEGFLYTGQIGHGVTELVRERHGGLDLYGGLAAGAYAAEEQGSGVVARDVEDDDCAVGAMGRQRDAPPHRPASGNPRPNRRFEGPSVSSSFWRPISPPRSHRAGSPWFRTARPSGAPKSSYRYVDARHMWAASLPST